MTSHYLYKWWPSSLKHICVTQPQWVNGHWMWLLHRDTIMSSLVELIISAKLHIFLWWFLLLIVPFIYSLSWKYCVWNIVFSCPGTCCCQTINILGVNHSLINLVTPAAFDTLKCLTPEQLYLYIFNAKTLMCWNLYLYYPQLISRSISSVGVEYAAVFLIRSGPLLGPLGFN